MIRFLPLVFALLLTAFMFYNPIGIAPSPSDSTQPLSVEPEYREEEVLSANGEFDYTAEEAVFNNQPVLYPKDLLVQAQNALEPDSEVLGTTNAVGEEKWIEIILAEQKLKAWEGANVVKEYLISSGLWNSTPRGTFYIWYKTRSQKMSGGSKEAGTYYYLPNVPHNMFFHGPYAIHGAYWHNNFGNVMSHGCVNQPLPEAAWIFDWAGPVLSSGNVLKASAENPGTRVWIH